MHIVFVKIQVKEEYIDDFITATIDNASNSICEEGVVRFNVIQQVDDPTRFVLEEAYRTQQDNTKHWETAHFARWRDTVEKMMASPRERMVYTNIFPND